MMHLAEYPSPVRITPLSFSLPPWETTNHGLLYSLLKTYLILLLRKLYHQSCLMKGRPPG
jgi:hypothetical protein